VRLCSCISLNTAFRWLTYFFASFLLQETKAQVEKMLSNVRQTDERLQQKVSRPLTTSPSAESIPLEFKSIQAQIFAPFFLKRSQKC
jgi:hypothetical protein